MTRLRSGELPSSLTAVAIAMEAKKLRRTRRRVKPTRLPPHPHRPRPIREYSQNPRCLIPSGSDVRFNLMIPSQPEFSDMIGGKMLRTVLAPMIADIKRVSGFSGIQKYRYVGRLSKKPFWLLHVWANFDFFQYSPFWARSLYFYLIILLVSREPYAILLKPL